MLYKRLATFISYQLKIAQRAKHIANKGRRLKHKASAKKSNSNSNTNNNT